MESVSAIRSPCPARGKTDYAKRITLLLVSSIDFADNCFHISASSTTVT